MLGRRLQLRLSRLSIPSRHVVRAFLLRACWVLTPSFIQHRLHPELAPPRRKLHPTSYLDGIRGLAAFIVTIGHLLYSCHNIAHGYGYSGGLPYQYHNLLRLPILRFFYTGTPQVALFFVVSGYSLSYKPLKLMRSRNRELLFSLSSSVLRRGIRLYLPCAASTLIITILVRLNVFEYTRAFSTNSDYLTGFQEVHPRKYSSLLFQLLVWAAKMVGFARLWRWDRWVKGIDDYDLHLWTIPAEFTCSLALFLTQLGVAKLSPTTRLRTQAGLIVLCILQDRWEMPLFYGGMILAELDLGRQALSTGLISPDSPQSPEHEGTFEKDPYNGKKWTVPRVYRPILWKGFWLLNFVFGIFFASQPVVDCERTPGWIFLCSIIPSTYTQYSRFWSSVGAIQMVWAVSNLEVLQRMYTSDLVQYLGRISFSIYLVHGMIIRTIGYACLELFWGWSGTDTFLAREGVFLAVAIFVTICNIWAADLFWRYVDDPSVLLAKRVEARFASWKDD